MSLNPLSPTYDFVFKKVFGDNTRVLKDFLTAVLDLPPEEYKGLVVIDPNLNPELADDKHAVLDVKVTTSTGKVIDIEVQVKRQRAIWQRMLFYTSKMVVEQVKRGYQYDKINKVISILITDFTMIEETQAKHSRFRYHDETTGVRFPDSPEINVLELPKVGESDGTHLGKWMRFFRAKTEEEFMTVARTNPAIDEAWGVIKVLSGDERTRALAEAREKARMDLDSWLGDAKHEGREEGLEEGLQKGRHEEKLAVARNLLKEKVPLDTISKATGLPLDEVKKLAAELTS